LINASVELNECKTNCKINIREIRPMESTTYYNCKCTQL